jgi:hypothetical protein
LKHRHIAWLLLFPIAVMAVIVVLASTRDQPPPTPNPPGTFSIGVLGDAPYQFPEGMQYRAVLEDIAAHELSLVVHVGDLFARSCTDQRYRRSVRGLNSLPHPVVYTPGDNEWTDCGRGPGGFAPLERLARIRQVFFANPARSLGASTIPLAHQGADSSFTEFVENARWVHRNIVFATVHLVGSGNATAPFNGRTEADDAAATRRTEAATAWLRETFAAARALNASAVVLAFHANAALEEAPDSPHRLPFDPFLQALEEAAVGFALPVLIVHGDGHDYIVDRPLTRRSTGQALPNVMRLQVPGSPDVGWVRVTVNPAAPEPFGFEARVMPRYKLW